MEVRRQSWLVMALVFGALYGIVGVVFAWPSNNVRLWRLAAWIACGALYAIHLGYEQFRLGNSTLATALHAAAAVGFGGLILAGSATIHKVVATSPSPYWRFMVAMVTWPIITAVPAFVVALAVGAVLSAARRAA
jgi:hypothetical protein